MSSGALNARLFSIRDLAKLRMFTFANIFLAIVLLLLHLNWPKVLGRHQFGTVTTYLFLTHLQHIFIVFY